MNAFTDEDAQWTLLDQCRALGIEPSSHLCGCEVCAHASVLCTATVSSLEMEMVDAARGLGRKSRRQLRRIASRTPWDVAVESGAVRDESK